MTRDGGEYNVLAWDWEVRRTCLETEPARAARRLSVGVRVVDAVAAGDRVVLAVAALGAARKMLHRSHV
jgi:hypothetical protein